MSVLSKTFLPVCDARSPGSLLGYQGTFVFVSLGSDESAGRGPWQVEGTQ